MEFVRTPRTLVFIAGRTAGPWDETASVVDHLPQGAPRPRDARPERLAGAVEDLGPVGVGQPEHVGEQVCDARRSREAQQHAVGAADPDLVHSSRYSTSSRVVSMSRLV
jgi:hypothetical protein